MQFEPASAADHALMLDLIGHGAVSLAWELALFAGFIFLLLGIDDLAVDALWLAGIGRRPPQPLSDLTLPEPAINDALVKGEVTQDISYRTRPGHFALFVPVWQEGAVIGAMLDCVRDRWGDGDYHIYVAAYPNDIATLVAVSAAVARHPRVRLVINHRPGPTSKGDNLNLLWHALIADQAAGRVRADAVILHDAEDVVDACELAAYRHALTSADYVQLPVIPLSHPRGLLVSGHYCDEFAEAHGKILPVRAAIGASIPLAGVGCAIWVDALHRVARDATGQGPFDANSVTEDYALGLMLAQSGARGHFARYCAADGRMIATRAYFPYRYADAVRQKARWAQGIALCGWDDLGWPAPAVGARADAGVLRPGVALAAERWATHWMLWRDRRTLISALAVLTGYSAAALLIAAMMIAPNVGHPGWSSVSAGLLFTCNALLLLWRMANRTWFTARLYGWRQGVLALARMPLANIILVSTSLRAIPAHVRVRRGAPPIWDKTAHEFPGELASANWLGSVTAVPAATGPRR